ncbi:MAG: Ig-like domain-containing protein [Bacteroidales bacterium]|jgi:uncharacterized protein YjdB|nr:Ig-like domain-containing protein [Bacteroidales bacterium]
MKRTFSILITILMMVSCDEQEKAVTATGLAISQTGDPAVLSVGETLTLTATVEPSGASQKIGWATDKPGVATVVGGVVTGILPGTVVVTATTIDGARSASVNVKVINPLSDIVFSQDAIRMPRGTKINLTFVFVPHSALNRTLEWSSSNPAIASIDIDSGEITANEYGKVIITATSRDDGSITASCEVEVIPILVTDVQVSSDVLMLVPGRKGNLPYAVFPENAEDQSVTWSSGDESIATVDAITGEVTAVSPGRVTITAASADGPFGEGSVWIPDLSNLGENMLVNPSFELPDGETNAFPGWTKLVDAIPGTAWFQNYPPYKAAGNLNAPGAGATLRVWNTMADYATGNFTFFTFDGKYACRINGGNAGGVYQEGITVTPGKTYYISAVIAYRVNSGGQKIHPAEQVGLHPAQSVKILSTGDGLILYHAVPIVTDPSHNDNLLRPEGLWTVPDDFAAAQVRFSVDQPNTNGYGPSEQRFPSPVMLIDDCRFQEVLE